MIKQTVQQKQEEPITAEQFLVPGSHEPVLGRARSIRKKPSTMKKDTLPSRPKLSQEGVADNTEQATRPPPVLPEFAVELFRAPDTEVHK